MSILRFMSFLLLHILSTTQFILFPIFHCPKNAAMNNTVCTPCSLVPYDKFPEVGLLSQKIKHFKRFQGL